jgi:hypothetical protein
MPVQVLVGTSIFLTVGNFVTFSVPSGEYWASTFKFSKIQCFLCSIQFNSIDSHYPLISLDAKELLHWVQGS